MRRMSRQSTPSTMNNRDTTAIIMIEYLVLNLRPSLAVLATAFVLIGATLPLPTYADTKLTPVVVLPATFDPTDADKPPLNLRNSGLRAEVVKAAMDTAHYLGQVIGKDVPLFVENRGHWRRDGDRWHFQAFGEKDAAPAGTPEIHVGWTSRAKREIDSDTVSKLDPDGFRLRSTGDAVFIVGATSWGTVYGCFRFLEEFCNVRWYLPGRFGEDVPQNPALKLTRFDQTYEPAYQHRRFSGFAWRDSTELMRWNRRMKLQTWGARRLIYSHNMGNVFDAAKYAETHPALFPLIGGQRRIPRSGSNSGWQPCLTHPHAVDVAMDYARRYFAKRPEAPMMSLGINDGHGHCECEPCMRTVETIDGREDRSRWYFAFANAVATRLSSEFPDKKIGFLLYGRVRRLPPDMDIHPNLVPCVAAQHGFLIDPKERKAFEAKLKEIAPRVKEFGFHDLFYAAGMAVPRLAMRQARHYLLYGWQMGARHVKAEAYMNWGLDGFRYWMYAQLMWDPTRDVDAMFEEFCTRFFKESADPMRAYWDIIEKCTTKPVYTGTGLANFAYGEPDQFASFPPAAIAECEPLLEQAERQARDPLVRERVRYFRKGFDVARILSLRYHIAKEAQPLLADPDTLPRGIAVLAGAMDPSLNVARYYANEINDDPYCVRPPYPAMMKSLGRCLASAADHLNAQVITELKRHDASPITEATLNATVARVLAPIQASVRDPNALDIARQRLWPLIGKVMLCHKTNAPVVDGELDDAAWQSTPTYGGFHVLGSGDPAPYQTTVRVVHDGKRLYAAIRCTQKKADLLAWTRNRDEDVFREDSIEFILNKSTDTTIKQRFQIVVNSQGNFLDYYNGGTAWDGDIQVGAKTMPDAYTVEFSIPFQEIGFDPQTDQFARVNVVRNVFGKKRRGHARGDISNWYLSLDNNLDLAGRGWIVFTP